LRPTDPCETKALPGRGIPENLEANAEDMVALSARLFGSDEAREAMPAILSRKS
jgi:enoyl-CoA hydratase/methylglutaconyl-CoA hydratase